MNGIISLLIWETVAVLAAGLMARKTNEWLREDKEQIYKCTTEEIIAGALILLMTGAAGYFAAEEASSVIAWMELLAAHGLLLAAAIIDYKLYIIPNQIPAVLILFKAGALIHEWIQGSGNMGNLWNSLMGLVLCGSALLLIRQFTKGGIGVGDVKLLMAMGFFGGIYMAFSTLLLALVSCSVTAAVLVFSRKLTWKDHVPFGPFLWFGYVGMILLVH